MLRQLLTVARIGKSGKSSGAYPQRAPNAGGMPRPLVLLLAMVSISAFALLALFWFAARNDREATLEQGWQSAERASELIVEYASRVFEISRQVTERAADRVVRSHDIGYFQGEHWAELGELARAFPTVGSLWIYDGQGNLVSNSVQHYPPSGNFADREFYPVLKGGAAYHIMGLTHGRVNNTRFFSYNLAARENGELTGIIQVSIHVDKLGKFFNSLGLGPEGLYRIDKLDGTVVVRWSIAGAEDSTNESAASLLREHPLRQREGRLEDTEKGVRYLRAYSTVPGFDLVVIASVPRETVLKPYWHRLGRNGALLGLAYLLLAGFAAAAFRAARREALEAEVREAAERGLQQSELRHRMLIEQCADGIFAADPQGRYIDVNTAGCAMFGFTREEILSRTIADVIEAGEIPRIAPELARFAGGKVALSEWRFKRKDGSVFVGEMLGRQLPDGRLQAIVRDITDRKQAEDKLREISMELSRTLDTAATGLTHCSRDLRYLSANAAYAKWIGLPPEQIAGKRIVDVMGQFAFDVIRPHVEKVLRGERVEYEAELAIEGSLKPIHVVYTPDCNASGAIVGWVASVTDISERKRREEKIQLLIREVNHRSKNMLSIVQAIARQTIASTPEDFLERFGDRVEALAASQDLLVKNAWEGVALADLVRSQVALFEDLIGSRIVLGGPAVLISASAAQTLGMALYELATNAGKHGALSNASGRIKIAWNLERTNGQETTFVMSWTEEAGPPVTPPSRQGFGATIIAEVVEASLDAKVKLDYAATGMRWHLKCHAAGILN